MRGVAVERADEEVHMPRLQRDVRLHLRALLAAQRRQTFDALPELAAQHGRRQLPPRALPHDRRRRLERQQIERMPDALVADVDARQQPRRRQPAGRLVERGHDGVHLVGGRECRPDEVLADLLLLGAAEQDAVRLVDGASGAPHLLVVVDDRRRRLVVEHEREVRLVEPHPQRRRRDERLDLVAEQRLLELLAPLALAAVRFDRVPPLLEPVADAPDVPDGERVDDAAPLDLIQPLREPRQPLGLPRHRDGLEPQRRAVQVAALHAERQPRHTPQVVEHAVGGGGRRRQPPHIAGQVARDALDAAVVGAEVVPPVGDAVRFVDHEQAHAAGDVGEQLLAEPPVAEALRRDEQHVDLAGADALLDGLPLRRVVGVDRLRADAHPAGGLDLVPHQREQRRDEDRGAESRLAQELRRDEVDEALAPPSALHDEERPRALHDVADGLLLTLAELRLRQARARPQQLQRALPAVFHASHPPARRARRARQESCARRGVRRKGQVSRSAPPTARRARPPP